MTFDLEYLRAALPGADVRYVSRTGSTNADLLSDASARAGTVLIAGEQTAGRGRMSRAFASPGGGLYMSVLLEPEGPDGALLITPRAAVAAAMAIERVSGRKTGIKWVNDVLIDGRKCCGILAEAQAGERLRVVLGIGVNVSAIPDGLEDTACAVFDAAPPAAREKLAAAILDAFFAPGCDVHGEYLRRCMVLGRELTVYRSGAVYTARAVSLDERFRLLVERPDGSRELLDSGEVSVRT